MASNPKIILIDGPAGAGKTTLSYKIQSELDCEIIHLDTLYNGWEDALTSRLTILLTDLLTSFTNGQEFEIPVFDWDKMAFLSSKVIPPNDALIIEGVGAGQSAVRKFATKLYWVEVDNETGLKRVLDRDGKHIEEQIKTWQLREAKHFEAERTREYADFIISTA